MPIDDLLLVLEAEIKSFNQDTNLYNRTQGLIQAYAQIALAVQIRNLSRLLEKEIPLLRGEIGKIR